MWKLQLYSLALRSNSLEPLTFFHTRSPARWLTLSRTWQNSLTLSSTCLHLLELLCTCLFSLVHLLARTLSNSLSQCSKTLQFSLASFTLFLRWLHLLRSYQILWKHFNRCWRCDCKMKFKRMFLVAEFNFRFQFLHVPVFLGWVSEWAVS